ncbi:biotin/lipoyl-containing protein, partial [uncultured Paracoccus sp.]
MGIYAIRMPDIGEGIAEAEIAEWLVKPGDVLREDDPMVAVMTDKATVEIPSPVTGTVIWQAGQPGDVIAVGAELVRLEVDGPGNVAEEAETPATSAGTKSATPEKPAAAPVPEPEPAPRQEAAAEVQKAPASAAPAPAAPAAPLRPEGEKPIASPAVRARAREAGVDLRLVRGSGPGGRISHDDL